ncbi:MAG: septal ring lytic transglycosylase RlpA family protein [Arenicellales bacterium WSBS_2016_MAG_OTU3]
MLLSVGMVACAMIGNKNSGNKNSGNKSSGNKNSGGYYQSDGPPKHGRVVTNTPDPIPRLEPFSKTGNKPYKVFGKKYHPMASATGFSERGIASWYGKQFHGRRTSSGEIYDMYKMTAAHPTLPLPTYVRVRNLDNGRTAVVRVNDRGPFKKGRIIDLSYAAASKLGVVRAGIAKVVIDIITPVDATNIVANSHSQSVLPANAEITVASPSLQHYVLVGTFSSAANAQQFGQQLSQSGYQPIQLLMPAQTGGEFYKVRVGPIASSSMAEDFRFKLSQSLAVDAVVVVE